MRSDEDMPAPRFVARARAILIRAGGNPEHALDLAEWAEDAELDGDSARGCVVGILDGSIMAEVRRVQWSRDSFPADYDSGRYVTECLSDPTLSGWELRGAMGVLRRATGQRTIYVTYADACLGLTGEKSS
jgi:hypothetical protein